jgi:Flp pilus assembly protein TadG
MTLGRTLKGLLRNTRGAALIEFAIAGPAFIVMFFGVFQTAVWLQNYNAVRSVASDVARTILVQYQRNNTLTDAQIQAIVASTAVNAPYVLNGENLAVSVSRPASRVTGATEINIAITYDLPNFLPFVSLDQLDVQYSRPIFVVNPT